VADDTRDSTDEEHDPAPNRYVIEATIIDGTIRLTGPDINNNVVEVPRGEDAVLKIKDVDGFYLNGAEIRPGGERSGCWGRNTERGLTRRKFRAVAGEINNIIYATASRDSGDVTYGPVLKVKPTG
jgi:hypothetical protein